MKHSVSDKDGENYNIYTFFCSILILFCSSVFCCLCNERFPFSKNEQYICFIFTHLFDITLNKSTYKICLFSFYARIIEAGRGLKCTQQDAMFEN